MMVSEARDRTWFHQNGTDKTAPFRLTKQAKSFQDDCKEISSQCNGVVKALKRRAILSHFLILSYFLAVGLTALHDHRDAITVPHAQTACEDSGLHLANHPDAPDLCCQPDHCSYCENRAPAVPIQCSSCTGRLAVAGPNAERSQEFRDLSPTTVRSCRAPPERA
jgi:hypothetical protein